LHAIETLIGGAQMPVVLDRAGEPRSIPTIVDRSAYRVVRDALAAAETATGATVAISYTPGALVVQVDDDGGSGRRAGLEGAAALAAAIGGGLKAAPAAGRFRVRAWLPTEGQPRFPAVPLAAH